MAAAAQSAAGHYLPAIKSNRRRLFKDVAALLDTASKPTRATQRGTAHGRRERRQAIVVATPKFGQPYGFPDTSAVGRIDSWRSEGEGLASHKVRYFVASRLLSAKALLDIVRAHWSIENSLHWELDVLFDEDACRTRKDHAPENLAAIRRLAINILQTTPSPQRISHKMLQAPWNNDFLLSAIARMR